MDNKKMNKGQIKAIREVSLMLFSQQGASKINYQLKSGRSDYRGNASS